MVAHWNAFHITTIIESIQVWDGVCTHTDIKMCNWVSVYIVLTRKKQIESCCPPAG